MINLGQVRVTRSNVSIHNGLIKGWNGIDSICGKDGAPGLILQDHSNVLLYGARTEGGQGGNGFNPGQDAPASIVDETSQIIVETGVKTWRHH